MWEYIPDIILEQIYMLLTLRQRYNCSSVCRHWANVFHSPRLWRHMIFTDRSFTRRRYNIFTGYRDEIYHRRLQLYLSHVGHHCQSITFLPIHNFYNLHEYLRVLSCFVEFFDDYTFPHLRKFHFTFACESREFKEVQLIGTGGQVLEEIKRLLRDLHGLTELSLNHLLLDISDATSLLDDVVKNCAHTLTYLELLNVTKVPYAINSITSFQALRRLFLTRRQLSPNVLIDVARETSLKELVIVEDEYSSLLCKGSGPPAANGEENQIIPDAAAAVAAAVAAVEEPSHVIDRQTWHLVTQINPSLRVRLEFRRSHGPPLENADDSLKVDLLPDGAPVHAVVHGAPNSHITFQSVAPLTELYEQTLQVYGHVGRGRGVRSKSFHDRADSALVYLIRRCPRLRVLAIHERVSTCTLLIIASEAKRLEEFYVRKNAVILRCDWPRHSEWTDDYWSWLRKNSKSYDLVELEISRLLNCRWYMLSDRMFRNINI